MKRLPIMILAVAIVAFVVVAWNGKPKDTRIVEPCFSNSGRYYTR